MAIGPVTVANLTAAAGAVTGEDGWWPCLDLTWRTPVPPSITRLVVQVKEDGSEDETIAETVVEPNAGTAEVMNGVAVGQHLLVRLAPAGAPAEKFQPTPWVEVTTPWDALMQHIDGLQVGCVKIVCGDGVPTRTDLPPGSLYVREDEPNVQLWQYLGPGDMTPLAIHFSLDNSPSMSEGELEYEIEAIHTILDQLSAQIDLGREIHVSIGYFGALSTFERWFDATTADVVEMKTYVTSILDGDALDSNYVHTIIAAEEFFEDIDPSVTNRVIIFVVDGPPTQFLNPGLDPQANAEEAASHIPGDVDCYAFTLNWDFDTNPINYAAVLDNTAGDGVPEITIAGEEPLSDAIADAIGLNGGGWILFSVLTSIRHNGVEVHGHARSLNFVGDNFEVEVDSLGNVTVTLPETDFSEAPIYFPVTTIEGLVMTTIDGKHVPYLWGTTADA